MVISAVFVSLAMPSCVSEDLVIDDNRFQNEPWNNPDLVPIPIGLSFEASTRSDEGTVDGTYNEHEIDFDTQEECYAIFFYKPSQTNEDKYVKYIAPLYLNKQLTDLYQPSTPTGAEYTVFAVAYVPKDDVPLEAEDYKDINEWEAAQRKPKLSDVLVVLNGGKVYKKFYNFIYSTERDENGNLKAKDKLTPEMILDITWDNPMTIKEHHHEVPLEDNGTIGFNAKGLFTMTNSAYYELNSKTKNYELKTLRPLEGKFYASIDTYLSKQTNKNEPTPNAMIHVERMVAKFSQPSLDTEVYGSQRFFRPSDNVPHLVVYDWIGEESHSQEIDWRIHLLGWTINGSESKSFMFKNLPPAQKDILKDWDMDNWNEEGNYRSYWSVDPHYHYDSTKTGIHDNDFYPWQYRKAADLSETVSWEAAADPKYDIHPALRYNTFNEIGWPETRYLAENTYNQDQSIEWPLDNRTEFLAGPHLLLTGEVYLKGQESVGSYLPSFGPVKDLYCDRIQRYYLTEMDFFKMFVTEFSHSVADQWTMTFPLLDWHDPSHKITAKYQAEPVGEYKLYFRAPADMFEALNNTGDATSQGLYDNLMAEPYYKVSGEDRYDYDEDKDYYFWSVSFSLLDALQYMKDNKINLPRFLQDIIDANGSIFSTNAQIYQGDGRMIPWLEHLHVRKLQENWTPDVTNGETEHDHPLIALNFKLAEGEDENSDVSPEEKNKEDFRSNIYKSFIKDWWGPVDHFAGGRMYYAGSIQHQNGSFDSLQTYYGTVRNHWYRFIVSGINSLGTPVDDPDQPIIPDKYAYKDQMTNYTEIVGWHLKDTEIKFDN